MNGAARAPRVVGGARRLRGFGARRTTGSEILGTARKLAAGRGLKSAPPNRIGARARGRAGLALIDCLIYIVLLMLLFGVTLAAFFETLRHSNELNRVAVTTIRALQAGEQWREDVRAARRTPTLLDVDGVSELRLTTASGEIAYAFRDGAILRRSSAGRAAPWLEVVDAIKVSRFVTDSRKHVTAWRWELELDRRRESQGVRRVLTFQAVPGLGGQP